MIAVYTSPESMTVAQYEEINKRLEADGVSEEGLLHHSCFGEDGHLMVYDVWESQAAYDAFAAKLLPILGDVGVSASRPPDVMPVVNLEQSKTL